MKQAAVNRNASHQGMATVPVGRAAVLVSLCAASLFGVVIPIAVAQERKDEGAQAGTARSVTVNAAQSAVDFTTWPLLDLIDARTNMAAFFRSGVPAELRVAALRRAWTEDLAIRDFKGLSENDWDFENPDSIPGFGEVGPEVNVGTMVAEILGTPTRVATLAPTNSYEPTSPWSLANTVRRLISGPVLN
jgi:hypothetical protein